MTNKEFAVILEKRTVQFAIDIITLSSNLPSSTEGLVIRNQLTKSGTSIGANYREANRSRSPRDFKNKIRISLAEASETDYWLEIIDQLNWSTNCSFSRLRFRSERAFSYFHIYCQ